MPGIGKRTTPEVMKNNPQKILFFITEDWFVCSHWLPLIEGAKRIGLEVVVVTRTGNHTQKILQLGVKVIPFDISRRGSNLFRETVSILRLVQVYRKERPDIAHHVAMKPILYGSLAAHLMGVPHTVNWVAGMGWLFVSASRRAKILRVIIQKALGVLLRGTTIIVENIDDRSIIANIGVAVQNIHLVRGAGVDTELFHPAPEPEGIPLVVLPARMLWDKGVGEFVAAARLLRQRGVQARFALVGEPDPENPASVPQSQLKDWQNEGSVEWWGRREDMPQVLAQCHIVCLPSYREGLPKALLEGASCGRPIVTTDVPGCREIARHGENGLLVEPHNAAALAEALADLLADAKLRQRMGRHGREHVLKEFSQVRIVSQVLALYREILT